MGRLAQGRMVPGYAQTSAYVIPSVRSIPYNAANRFGFLVMLSEPQPCLECREIKQWQDDQIKWSRKSSTATSRRTRSLLNTHHIQTRHGSILPTNEECANAPAHGMDIVSTAHTSFPICNASGVGRLPNIIGLIKHWSVDGESNSYS